MEEKTTPSPDHMPIEIFQSCWEVIKKDLLQLFTDLSAHKLDVGRLNYVVHLNPKTERSGGNSAIKDYLPIKSQLQNDHKVIGVDV
jgi:hypothetical protein